MYNKIYFDVLLFYIFYLFRMPTIKLFSSRPESSTTNYTRYFPSFNFLSAHIFYFKFCFIKFPILTYLLLFIYLIKWSIEKKVVELLVFKTRKSPGVGPFFWFSLWQVLYLWYQVCKTSWRSLECLRCESVINKQTNFCIHPIS